MKGDPSPFPISLKRSKKIVSKSLKSFFQKALTHRYGVIDESFGNQLSASAERLSKKIENRALMPSYLQKLPH
ncbi:MAG: hypothetical protein OXC92_10945 [Flavobacteriaceae bacterium]|nr:hypothetical protein [Flavobacteriaceae bacterium]